MTHGPVPESAVDPGPRWPGRVAFVHDWLTGMRGGERVLEVLCEIFPRADVFTLFHVKGSVSPVLEGRVAGCSFLARLPGLGRYYRYLLPLFPLAVEGLRLDGYESIVSISHCVSKGVLPPPASRHLCYCLTPMRYCWDLFPLYFGSERHGGLAWPIERLVAHYLRLWDLAASSRVRQFVAVSRFVAARIRAYYGRRAVVVYPPVDLKRFKPAPGATEDFYLVVAPDAPNKRIDVVLEAFRRLDRPVKIVGGRRGQPPRIGRRLGSGGGKIEWLGWVSEETLTELYARCRALVSAGLEDFGMAPVEAQASGRPVIAYGAGGALESVRGIPVRDVPKTDREEWLRRGYTAVLFDRPNGQALAEAVECFERVEDRFPVEVLRKWAARFDRSVFEEKWRSLLSGQSGRGGAGI